MELRLTDPPEDLNFVSDIFRGLLDHVDRGLDEDDLLERVAPGQRALYTLWILDGEVNNGGFSQYFTNPGGAQIRAAIEGAALIEATAHEQILREAAAVFPHSEVPTDYAARNDLYDSLPVGERRKLDQLDGRWYDAGVEELESRLRAYIARHPEEFFQTG